MDQNEQKRQVARAARDYVAANTAPGAIIGVGTGSTANLFIDELASIRDRIAGAVASSEASAARLASHGIAVLDLNTVESLPIYVDGADEIDAQLMMLKGGGGALTREKIVAAVAETFVCLCDETKRVTTLGRFPLPLEVIPMARAQVARAVAKLGGEARLRAGFSTDNGNLILDVHGLAIADPRALERRLNDVVGIVANGLFALRGADLLLLASAQGVASLRPAPPATNP